MMRTVLRFVFLSILLITQFNLKGQSWEKLIVGGGSSGNEVFNDMHVDSDGNVYLIGSFSGSTTFGNILLTSNGATDFFVVKYDSSGNQIYAVSGGSPSADLGNAIVSDNNGNAYITGQYSGFFTIAGSTLVINGSTDAFTIKIDALGSFVWAKKAGGFFDFYGSTFRDRGIDIAYDNGNGIYVAGVSSGQSMVFGPFLHGPGQGDATDFIGKYDLNGNEQWIVSASDPNSGLNGDFSLATTLTYSPVSNSIIAGGYNSILISISGGGISKNSDLFFRQILPNGSFGWYRQFGGTAQEEVYDIVLDSSGNIYATGLYNGSLEIPAGNTVATSINNGQNSEVSDAFILKLNPNGSTLNYVKTLSGSQDIDGLGIASSSTGTVYVTGQYKGNPGVDNVALNPKGEYDIFLLRIDSIGTLNWVEEAGGNGDDVGVNLAVRNDKKIILSGGFSSVAQFGNATRTSLGFSDAFLAKLDCKPGAPSIIPFDSVVCLGDTSQFIFPQKFGLEYSWILQTGGVLDTINGNANVIWTQSGIHTLTAIPSNVCGTGESRDFTVRVKDVPNAPLVLGDTSQCLGLGTYTINNPGNLNYQWSLSGGGSLVQLNQQALVSWSSPGIYQLSSNAINECGIGDTSSINISIAQFPSGVIIINGSSSSCFETDTFTINSQPETNYTWDLSSGGSIQAFDTFAVVNWTQAGNHIVRVTPNNICGTGSPSSKIVNVITSPSKQEISGDSIACIGSSSYSLPNQSGLNYNWNLSGGGNLLNLGNTAIVNWTNPGNYTIIASLQNSCGTSEPDTFSVTVKSSAIQPGPISGNIQTCLGTDSYNVSQQADQAYEWSLSSGGNLTFVNNQASINWTQTGFHTITVTAINSCGTGLSRDLVVEVRNVPNQPGVIFGNNNVCLGLQSYNVFAESGVTYNWSLSGGGQIFPSGNSVSVNWTLPGTYDLIVTPSNSCGNGAPRIQQIVVKDVPNNISGISGIDTVCLGSQIYTVENPQTGPDINYNWSLSGGGIIAPNGNSATINWNSPGTYTLTVQAQNSCGFSQSFSKFINVRNTSAQFSSISGDSEVCLDTSLYQVPDINGFTYNWSISGGGILNVDSNIANVIWQNTGNYTISVTTSDGCSKSLPVEVKDIPSQPSAIGGDTIVCFGSKSYAVQPQSGITFNWALDGGGSISQFGNASIINWNNTGLFNISVSASNLCGTGPTRQQSVNVLTIPTSPDFVTPNTLVCNNQNINYSVNPKAFESYSWTLDRAGLLNQNDTVSTVNWLDTGIAILGVNGTNLCGTGPLSTIVVVINDIPQAPLISGPDKVCLDTISFSSPFNSGLTYFWNLLSGGILNDSSNFAEVIWTNTGPQVLELSLGNNCGTSPTTVFNVEVFDLPSRPQYAQGDSLVCLGLEAYTLISNPEETYTWSFSGGGILNPLGNSATINWTNTGLKEIYTEATNLCGSGPVDTFQVEVRDIPLQPSTISGDANVCLDNRVYSVNPINNVQYTWTLNGNGLLNSGDSASASVDWTNTGLAVINVTASNLCGSSPSQSKSISIADIPATPSFISGDTLSCIGNENYVLNSFSGFSYNWNITGGGTLSPNGNQANVNWNQTGNWEIIVSQSNYCGISPEDTLDVRIKTIPFQTSFINPDTLVCLGNIVYQVVQEPEATYSFSLNGGGGLSSVANQAFVTWNNPGIYNISVNPQNICGSGPPTSLSVDVNTIPNIPVFVNLDTLSCLGPETFTVQNQAGADFLWNLSGGGGSSSSGNQFNVNWTSIGNFNIDVSAFNFCGASPVNQSNITVSQIPNPPLLLDGDSISCLGNSVYNVNPTQNINRIWNLSGGGILNASTDSAIINWIIPGNFNIEVFSENYCGLSQPLLIPVQVKDVPERPVNLTGPTAPCKDDIIQYSVLKIDGLQYNWRTDMNELVNSDSSVASLIWISNGQRSLIVSSQNECGESPESVFDVNVRDVPSIQGGILGDAKICNNNRETYEVSALAGVNYLWRLESGGEITAQENTATVDWQEPGIYQLELRATNICGEANPVQKTVVVDSFPFKPLIRVKDDTLFSSSVNDNIWFLNGEIFNNSGIDFIIPEETGRYELQIVNSCGSSELSNFLSFYGGENLKSEIYLIPNPANIETRLQLPLNLQVERLRITNLEGREMFEGNEFNSNRLILPVNTLTPGVYLIEVIVSSGEKVTKRLVVN